MINSALETYNDVQITEFSVLPHLWRHKHSGIVTHELIGLRLVNFGLEPVHLLLDIAVVHREEVCLKK